jgi:hypothetical protein
MTLDALRDRLNPLLDGLWFPSETEADWAWVAWQDAPADVAHLCQQLDLPLTDPVTTVTAEDFLAQVERRCRSYGAAGNAIAQRYQELVAFCQQHLADMQIVRVGTCTVTVAILGLADTGEAIALHTQSVET